MADTIRQSVGRLRIRGRDPGHCYRNGTARSGDARSSPVGGTSQRCSRHLAGQSCGLKMNRTQWLIPMCVVLQVPRYEAGVADWSHYGQRERRLVSSHRFQRTGQIGVVAADDGLLHQSFPRIADQGGQVHVRLSFRERKDSNEVTYLESAQSLGQSKNWRGALDEPLSDSALSGPVCTHAHKYLCRRIGACLSSAAVVSNDFCRDAAKASSQK